MRAAAGAARISLVSAWWLALFRAGLPTFVPLLTGAILGRVGLRAADEAIVGALVATFGSVGRLLTVVNPFQPASSWWRPCCRSA